MLFLSEDQVRRLAPVEEVLRVIREAFARDYTSTLRMPPRSSLELNGALLLLMPAYDSALNAAGVKMVSVSQRAGVQASYELLDAASGMPLARMEANWLTDLRTAATSAVATDLLARSDAETLGIFGSGRQAVSHLTAISRVRKFRRFLVCGSGRSNLSDFCAMIKQTLGIEAQAVSAETCAREAQVICTCTNSRVPLFDGRWLRPGTHLNLIGAFQPDAREVGDETLRRSRVVVETYEGVLSEAGDLLIPMNNGTITRSHVLADLHELASGKKSIRTAPDQITLFKGVGCALEDLVTAHMIYRRAKEQG
jgi:ornithine cyclodeaminase/alanine dehydrogenase